jgi:hypothetical protein
MRGLGLAMALFLMAGCTKDDEWCTQLVKDACGCEGDDPDSDLCQDAGVVADEEDEDTCESYYFANVPEECQTETFTSDEPSTACDVLAAKYCACDCVGEVQCDVYTEALSTGGEIGCEAGLGIFSCGSVCGPR